MLRCEFIYFLPLSQHTVIYGVAVTNLQPTSGQYICQNIIGRPLKFISMRVQYFVYLMEFKRDNVTVLYLAGKWLTSGFL